MGRNALVALIDGDILLYQALAVTSVDFDGELVPDILEATKAFDNILEKWFKGSNADEYQVFLSGGHNFRKKIAPSYKSGRGPKPNGFEDIKQYAIKTYKPKIVDQLEADDMIGIALTAEKGHVAVSIDKDMKTVPGLHYNPDKDKFTQINEEEANLNWMRQTLMGDTIDGYTGIPKIGSKRAEALLPVPAPLPVLWRVVLDAYEKAKLDPKYAVATARLAYILRNGDYDATSRTIRWTDIEPAERDELPAEYRRNVPSSGSARTARPRRKADGGGD